MSSVRGYFNFHVGSCTYADGSVAHHADHCSISEANNRVRVKGIEELSSLLGSENGSFTNFHDALGASNGRRWVHLNDLADY